MSLLFGGTDIYPNAAQDTQTTSIGNALLNFPIVLAGVAVGVGSAIANLIPSGGNLQLTASNLNDIFTGAVTLWSQLAPNNPFLSSHIVPIQVVSRSDSSGDTANFTGFLAKAIPGYSGPVGNGPFAPSPPGPWVGVTASGNSGIQSYIISNGNSIGYLAYGYTQATNGDPTTPLLTPIAVAAIQNSSANFVAPSVSSIQVVGSDITTVTSDLRLNTLNTSQPSGYPITNPTNIVVLQIQPTQSQALRLRQVLQFFITTGQGQANTYYLGSLPSVVVNQFLNSLYGISWIDAPFY